MLLSHCHKVSPLDSGLVKRPNGDSRYEPGHLGHKPEYEEGPPAQIIIGVASDSVQPAHELLCHSGLVRY